MDERTFEEEAPKIRIPYPVGTIKELRQIGVIDLREFIVCGPPNRDEGITSCVHWRNCPLRGGRVMGYDFKDDVIRGEHGPVHLGVSLLADKTTGRKAVNSMIPCYDLSQKFRMARNRNWVLRIKAREGEKIRMNVGRLVEETIPGQGLRRTWQQAIEERVVPAFKRPGENPDLMTDQLAAAEAADFHAENEETMSQKFYGQVSASRTNPDPEEGNEEKEKGGRKSGPAARG